ncbi:SGNH/GDSL hydrolase family protein [Paenibacillus doosanensis]|uniref:SGNH/GDSL hydrolase family protein n=1 Tax=Paenibacillus doosanensis TaxID=1229154 RepID=UPI00217F2BA0|nr:SGNH/GDSL hydrolase family protein [Paenibacillus doosanensis]MCS7464301.1 SGNH/GDSL hydrolase family protein [Paenibacillus doosanensis]
MRQLFVIGDSISIQYGPYLRSMVEGKFGYDRKRGEEQALVDLDKPVGANGGDSAMLLDYLREEHSRGTRYDILLLNCGLHDMKTSPRDGTKQVPLEAYHGNLREIVELAKAMANDVVWVRTTDALEEIHNAKSKSFYRFHADALAYNETADRMMKASGIPLVDLYGFSRTFGPEAFGDHVHYTDEVRKLQAAFIAGYLDALFA